jgi:hypothetical protein
MGGCKQGRGAGDEKSDGRGRLPVERRVSEKPRVERWHAHHGGRARQEGNDLVGVEFRKVAHQGARTQNDVGDDELAVRVINRERMQLHVITGKLPGSGKCQGFEIR